jgi:3-methyl-2-oxobutanoate hydroxymethyltransferase
MKLQNWVRSKKKRKRWTMLTAYDAPTAQILVETGVDILLVGDSVGMVLLGYDSTLPVTMGEMLHHAKAVRRGAPKAFVIGDMPYDAVRRGPQKALEAARRFMKEGRCDAVKVEWRRDAVEIVTKLVKAGIPVMGHLGLVPQEAAKKGGFKVQATRAEDAAAVCRQAALLEKLGAFGVLLECVPENVSREITKRLRIPTFGIGAGRHCDGQVLVFQDVVGAFRKFRPKFVKTFADTDAAMRKASASFVSEVKSGRFPREKHSFHMQPAEKERFKDLLR